MKCTGLFAGIGGIELGLSSAGHETMLLCETAAAARAVLSDRMSDIELLGDVRDLRDLPSDTDLVSAGFPCQDLSQAGHAAGITGSRSSLVDEVFRLASRHRPKWILLENVPFMLQLGRGAGMVHIVDRLEDLGYLWAWRIVDAYGFGIPQRRRRVYLLASSQADPADVLLVDDAPIARPKTNLGLLSHGFYWTEGKGGLGWAVDAVPTLKNGSTIGIPSPPAILLPDGRIVKPDLRDAERLQGFVEDWTQAADRVGARACRWGLVGNAVCVPVAAWIGRRLRAPGSYDRARDLALRFDVTLPSAARYDGNTRKAVAISADPIGEAPPAFAQFLLHPGQILGRRATTGFLRRTRQGRLRFQPGFIELVEAHLSRLTD